MIKIAIGDRLVGDGEKCFIIAEAGVNHNGNIKKAKKLIDVAVKSDVDAIKFQTFKTDSVVTKSAEKAAYQKASTGSTETQYDMIKKLELSSEDFIQLAEYAQKREILFLSTPFDFESVDLLDEIGVPAYKIPSGEITNFPLLKYIAQKQKPVILSTGMSTLAEIECAINIIRKNQGDKIILLHCVTDYPANITEINLKAMNTLRCSFQLPVGYSDHTLGISASIAAVALGACVIEKHFTLSKNLPGPDHKASLEPKDLEILVKTIRDIELALGDGIKKPTPSEEEIKMVARRSIVAKKEIPKDAVITEEMLTLKRPATGLPPDYLNIILGRTTKRIIKKDELVSFNDLSF
jgi:N,N'-diacetyllegionaminate synthase